ncbi:DUF6409 family protein [[Kitasatospora] papulosa]|uniref:DUF6409 family protein n=1 Tax=[Kitasatospora] papulosa TaxID=1464011 RepID=UPI0036B96AD5
MAAVTTFEAGDIVKGRPLKSGVQQAVRKGIVLGLFHTDPSAGYIVWWYGKGPASMHTTSMMLPRELTPAGSLDDVSEALARRIERGCGQFERARSVGFKAANRRLQLRKARRDAALYAARYRLVKLRGGWAVEDTTNGAIWTGLPYVGAVALKDRKTAELYTR